MGSFWLIGVKIGTEITILTALASKYSGCDTSCGMAPHRSRWLLFDSTKRAWTVSPSSGWWRLPGLRLRMGFQALNTGVPYHGKHLGMDRAQFINLVVSRGSCNATLHGVVSNLDVGSAAETPLNDQTK